MRTSTHFAGRVLGCCLLAASFTFASAQEATPAKPAVGTPAAPSQVYGKLLGILEKQFVDAAEAMPEDKFDFAPPTTAGEFKGVRTFSAEVKHVAEANYYFFGGSTFTEADMKTKSDAIDKLKTKVEVVQALKDSFTQAQTFVDGITPDNAFITTEHGTRAGMAAFGIAHFMDHYGQMVEYLRMNGIVPPASRGSM
jgi:uncharacterized damage-inducible protein DinB